MINHKSIDKIILSLVALVVVLTVLVMSNIISVPSASFNPPYKEELFDKTKVHHINIIYDDWDNFIENATIEEYVAVDLVIDGEKFEHVGLRTKGNNSLRITDKYNSNRYSLKIEFDHYFNNTYYGLDKFNLDASFQDNSYLKTYMTMDMMEYMGVATPLTSYTWVTVNDEDWGLFLALEEPEEAFAQRNYGKDYGQLYKPDYKKLNDENADVALRYTSDDILAYDNIFRNAKFKPTLADKNRLINSLKILDSKVNLQQAINIDRVIRYFTVQVFVVNMDSYLGKTGHNYFLHEKNGILEMIPWDYNLAFATYSLGMPNPINDSTLYINYPIDTPAAGEIMKKRPLYHHLMQDKNTFKNYHKHFRHLIDTYFKSNRYKDTIDGVTKMIDEYVKKDPTRDMSYADYLIGVETITKFMELRAESIDLQLQGIIPSTIKGQSEDKSNFIDGSPVWLPDMGEVADLKDDYQP